MLADFITLDQPRYAEPGRLDAAYLIYGGSARGVTNVVIGGRTVLAKEPGVRGAHF
jgi:hypothetical protein